MFKLFGKFRDFNKAAIAQAIPRMKNGLAQ